METDVLILAARKFLVETQFWIPNSKWSASLCINQRASDFGRFWKCLNFALSSRGRLSVITFSCILKDSFGFEIWISNLYPKIWRIFIEDFLHFLRSIYALLQTICDLNENRIQHLNPPENLNSYHWSIAWHNLMVTNHCSLENGVIATLWIVWCRVLNGSLQIQLRFQEA